MMDKKEALIPVVGVVTDIRIDTHCDNMAMRSLLKKMGYTHCGRITLTSGAYREAYQKELKK